MNGVRGNGRDVLRLLAALAGLLAALALALAGLPARADGSVGAEGRVDVSYVYEGDPVAGATVSVYRVGSWDGAGAAYVPEGAFAGYDVDWGLVGSKDADDADLRALALTLSSYAQRDGVGAVAAGETDAAGAASFDGLARGLYLVSVGRVGDGARVCEPASLLVALPANTGDGQSMAVALEPKTECEAVPETADVSVRKVWRGDDDGKRPSRVSVQLLRDGVAYDEVTLDASNGWAHEWTGLDAGYDWRVVERDVPDGYVTMVDREGLAYTVTNTGGETGHTGSATTPVVTAALIAAGVAVLLFTILHTTRRHQDER